MARTPVQGSREDWRLLYHSHENGFRTLGRQALLEPFEWTADSRAAGMWQRRERTNDEAGATATVEAYGQPLWDFSGKIDCIHLAFS